MKNKSQQLKEVIINEILDGEKTILSISREYNTSISKIDRWKKEYERKKVNEYFKISKKRKIFGLLFWFSIPFVIIAIMLLTFEMYIISFSLLSMAILVTIPYEYYDFIITKEHLSKEWLKYEKFRLIRIFVFFILCIIGLLIIIFRRIL